MFQLGPISIRWYSMAYLVGWAFAWWYTLKLISKRKDAPCNAAQVGDFAFYAMIGVIAGGRFGYVLFYNFSYYIQNPSDIFAVWDGGMSFHGGFLGVAIATILYCRKAHIKLFQFTDLLACVTPVALFLGRMANFINGELYGRETNSILGMVFPHGGPNPRHPSQIYEALLEGFVLFIILNLLYHYTKIRNKAGVLTGLFILGYSGARVIVEQFREPDSHIGYLFGSSSITMGQLLSWPMILFGLYLILRPQNK